MAPTTPIRPARPNGPPPPVPKDYVAKPVKERTPKSKAPSRLLDTLNLLIFQYEGCSTLSQTQINRLIAKELVAVKDARHPATYVMTSRGVAHVRQILALALPVAQTQWFGANGEVIPMFDEEGEDD